MRIGLQRKVDNLGRITIPKEYRDFYRLNEQTVISLIETPEGLLLSNPKFKVVCIDNNWRRLKNARSILLRAFLVSYL